jgi:hypothetical protein
LPVRLLLLLKRRNLMPDALPVAAYEVRVLARAHVNHLIGVGEDC